MATRLFRSAEKEHGGRKTTVEDITLLGDCVSLFGQMRRKEGGRLLFVSAVSVRRFFSYGGRDTIFIKTERSVFSELDLT
jgi:hypothetical protein